MCKTLKKIITIVVIVSICIAGAHIIGDIRLKAKRWNYYQTDEVYTTIYGEIQGISFNENEIKFYVSYTESIDGFSYPDDDFVIVGENVDTIMSHESHSLLKEGAVIEFVSAPAIYWNGYRRPAVAIKVDDVQLLEYEEGKANFLKWLRWQFP